MILRPYQTEAVNAAYNHLRNRDDNPCIAIPTAGGKTPVMASICRDTVLQWQGRILILAHVKELLEQAVEKLHLMAPELWRHIGVYSAGLKSRDTEHSIIVAGVQSVYQRACELGSFNLILIDEAHMIPPDGEGMYRTFLQDAKIVNPEVRLIGLTATPYRMSSGMICAPENLLNSICYEVGVKELIVQGYLCPLKSKGGKDKIDTSSLHVRGGEFIAGEVEDLMDDDYLVEAACKEIVGYTQDRNACLIFASGIAHAMHIQTWLERLGCECGIVTGNTPAGERAQILQAFKDGKLHYLVNVNVLTTGFDAPNIDTVAMLRPTLSPGLYYQMVGRGFRLHPNKSYCLVLDFGSNILRHGPVDALRIESRSSNGSGEAPAKQCPQCQAVIHAGYTVCPDCGYEFPPPEKNHHGAEASSKGILSGQITDSVHDVTQVDYNLHHKSGKQPTMRVDYYVEDYVYACISEWICFEHGGYARHKAEQWWQARCNDPVPSTVEEALQLTHRLAETKQVTIRQVAGEKFDRIQSYVIGGIPGDSVEEEPELATTPEESWYDETDIPF